MLSNEIYYTVFTYLLITYTVKKRIIYAQNKYAVIQLYHLENFSLSHCFNNVVLLKSRNKLKVLHKQFTFFYGSNKYTPDVVELRRVVRT